MRIILRGEQKLWQFRLLELLVIRFNSLHYIWRLPSMGSSLGQRHVGFRLLGSLKGSR